MRKSFLYKENIRFTISKPDCIFDFEDNDMSYDVLKELDKFKSEYESERGFKAREFLFLYGSKLSLIKNSELFWLVTFNNNEGTHLPLAIEVEQLAKEKENTETSAQNKK